MVTTAGGMVVLAVDDERPALDELAYLLGADAHVDTVLTASDAAEALRIISPGAGAQRASVDAVFLDIRMPGLDGVELARVFARMTQPPSVVFVTANDDRAVDAYELGAVDYLLKPLRSERLGASLDRVAATRAATAAEIPHQSPDPDEVIPVELAGTMRLVPRSEVRYVEAQGDYARLHTAGGSHLVRIPLTVLEERWAGAGFLRVHRSYLVALASVTAFVPTPTGHAVLVDGGADAVEIPVSRRLRREVRDRLRAGWGEPADDTRLDDD
jgi:DNA-binding LytR/AlgR family response regulator